MTATTRAACEQQARIFLETLYAGQPERSVIAISEKHAGGWGRSRFPLTPADALGLVVGAVDIYTRITPLAGRPANGRGTAGDSIALPGVWAEFDINGSPDGRGGRIDVAFPSINLALELAHRVLEPTMAVRSGYGLHCYWLLDHMLELADEEDRRRAAELVQGFQARLRQLARDELGVEKFDSTHDLARVFRPPGSFNAKGEAPVLVELLDDGGRRYALEELQEHAVKIETHTANTASTSTIVDIPRLLERHERLAKIVARKGRNPGDGSPSAWDYYLACTGAELQLSDPELEALLRHARHVHGEDKGERDDYVERTAAAARAKVGYPAHDPEDIRAQLTALLQLEQVGLRVVDVQVAGEGNDARVVLRLDDGSAIVFRRFRQVTNATELASHLATSTGVIAEFNKAQATTIAALIRRYVGRAQVVVEHTRTSDRISSLLRLAVDHPFTLADTASRWQTWERIGELDPENDAGKGADAYARKVIIPRDIATGDRYIRAGWLQEYIRRLPDTIDKTDVLELAISVGLTRPGKDGRIKATNPGKSQSRALWFYVVPAGWEDAQEVPE